MTIFTTLHQLLNFSIFLKLVFPDDCFMMRSGVPTNLPVYQACLHGSWTPSPHSNTYQQASVSSPVKPEEYGIVQALYLVGSEDRWGEGRDTEQKSQMSTGHGRPGAIGASSRPLLHVYLAITQSQVGVSPILGTVLSSLH